MNHRVYLAVLFIIFFLTGRSQQFADMQLRHQGILCMTALDTLLAARCPVLTLQEHLKDRSLPAVVDNSQNEYWPGIRDQLWFYTCQQYAGVNYTFGYEINRLRNQPGWYWENNYPAHYSWNLMNNGYQFQGVSFLQSWEIIRQQGHMTQAPYPWDTAYDQYGWVSGYDLYRQGMSNRLKKVWSIPINNGEGVATLKQFLYDRLGEGIPGGVACLTVCSHNFSALPHLPLGTSEEGKAVVIEWLPDPVHGIVIVGYNDSIRYDINGDGQYTIDKDITGEGIVDIRDWEIGGFRFANSYGTWWEDVGYAYVMYRAMAMDFEEGGVWNNAVYVMDADDSYQPLLTMKATIQYNLRNQIRIMAGISTDTLAELPEFLMDFPLFRFQGGAYPMQGYDTLTGGDTLELGLDVTPLLQYATSGQPARFFMVVEERDPDGYGHGSIRNLSFINTHNGGIVFPGPLKETMIRYNGMTFLSAIGSVLWDPVHITTSVLPSFSPGQNYQVILFASGGRPPYTWSFAETLVKSDIPGNYQTITDIPLPIISEYQPFTRLILPFEFPFFNHWYDTLYVNRFGFITFEPLAFPVPYTTNEEFMLKSVRAICPAFSTRYMTYGPTGNGQWARITADSVIIRWNCDVDGYSNYSDNNFEVILFPDGRIIFHYGSINNEGYDLSTITGFSRGDGVNYDLSTNWDSDLLSGKSFQWMPPVFPGGIAISEPGLLTVTFADTGWIYDIPVRVTDADGLPDIKTFALSSEIRLEHQLISVPDNHLQYGSEAFLRMTITNTGMQQIQNLQLHLFVTDPAVIITDSLETIDLIGPGEKIIIDNAFSLKLQSPLQDRYPLWMTILAETALRQWQKKIMILNAAPDISIEPVEVCDGYNRMLDSGEVADLLFNATNIGTNDALDLTIHLSSLDSLVHILTDSILVMTSFKSNSRTQFRFMVQASRYASWGASVPMELTISNELGIDIHYSFSLLLGNKPVSILKLANSTFSFDPMVEALDSLRVPFDTSHRVPLDPNHTSYFILLGTTGLGAHILTVEEGGRLAAYLQNGGNIYMEGYATWYYYDNTPLHPMFHYVTEKVPAYEYDTVIGIPATFTEVMTFGYPAAVNYAIFALYPKGNAFATFTNGNPELRNLEIAYNGEDYKTIGSLVEFGSLTGNSDSSSKVTLMKRYLEFFDINFMGPWPLFHADQTSVCAGAPVTFHDDSFFNIQSRVWNFPGGSPAMATGQDPVVTYSVPGSYTVRLAVSDGDHIESIEKKDYITIYDCVAIDETNPFHEVHLYPNPTSGILNIDGLEHFSDAPSFFIHDLRGKTVQKCIISNNRHVFIDLSGLIQGFYILTLQNCEAIKSFKILKD